MAKTEITLSRELMVRALDSDHFAHVYGMQNYALGGKYQSARAAALSMRGELPFYAPIKLDSYTVGESRRLLNNQAIMMMKVCYHSPEPDFPELADEITQELRREWVKHIWESRDVGNEVIRAFLDGDGLGLGIVEIKSEDGLMVARRHRRTNVLVDPYATDASRARYAAIVYDMPTEEAVAMFGSKVARAQVNLADSGESLSMPIVRIVKYVDRGIAKSEPTCTYFLSWLGGDVLHSEATGYDFLPLSFYIHWHPYDLKHPVGRIDMQVGTQEMRAGLWRHWKKQLERGAGFDIINTTGLTEESLRAYMMGETQAAMFYNGDQTTNVGNMVNRIPAAGIDASSFHLHQLLDIEQNTESGSSDADRANISQKQKTLGEIELTQSGADTQTAWSQRQYARFLMDIVEKMVKMGRKEERAPFRLQLRGTSIQFNDPKEPKSAFEPFLEEESRVVVSEDNTTYKSQADKRKEAISYWSAMMQDPYSNPLEVRRKIYEAMGERNPDAFINPELVQTGGVIPQPLG